jgi:hypothetical protein
VNGSLFLYQVTLPAVKLPTGVIDHTGGLPVTGASNAIAAFDTAASVGGKTAVTILPVRLAVAPATVNGCASLISHPVAGIIVITALYAVPAEKVAPAETGRDAPSCHDTVAVHCSPPPVTVVLGTALNTGAVIPPIAVCVITRLLITILKLPETLPASFAAVTETVKSPVAVGVPLITPVTSLKLRPAGNVPVKFHVTGAVPDTNKAWLYDMFTVPEDNEFTITGASGASVTDNDPNAMVVEDALCVIETVAPLSVIAKGVLTGGAVLIVKSSEAFSNGTSCEVPSLKCNRTTNLDSSIF